MTVGENLFPGAGSTSPTQSSPINGLGVLLCAGKHTSGGSHFFRCRGVGELFVGAVMDFYFEDCTLSCPGATNFQSRSLSVVSRISDRAGRC